MPLDKINFNKLSESIDVLQQFLTVFKEAIAPLTDEGSIEKNQPVGVPTSNETIEMKTPKGQPIPEPTPENMVTVKEELEEEDCEKPSSSAVASMASQNLTASSPPAPKRRVEEIEADIFSKRVRIAGHVLIAPPPPPPPHNEFTIFNFKGESPLTHAAIVWNLRLLGIDEVLLTDIRLIHGEGICRVSASMDVKFVKFQAIGMLEERLNGWVDRDEYVEEIHLENMRNYANSQQYSYLLNDVSREGIAIFSMYFFTAQEVMQNATWRPRDCRLSPKYVEFRYEQGSIRLTLEDLLTPNWLSPAKIAFMKMTKAFRRVLIFKTRLLGLEAKLWMAKE